MTMFTTPKQIGALALTALAFTPAASCSRETSGSDAGNVDEIATMEIGAARTYTAALDVVYNWYTQSECRQDRLVLSDKLRTEAVTLRDFAQELGELANLVSAEMSESELSALVDRMQAFLKQSEPQLGSHIATLSKIALQIDDLDTQESGAIYRSLKKELESLEPVARSAVHGIIEEWSRTPAYYAPGESADTLRHLAGNLQNLRKYLVAAPEQIRAALANGNTATAHEEAIIIRRVILTSFLPRVCEAIQDEAVYIDNREGDRRFSSSYGVPVRASIPESFKHFLLDNTQERRDWEMSYGNRFSLVQGL